MTLDQYQTYDPDLKLATAISSSGGVSDANKVVATGADGKLGASLFPLFYLGTTQIDYGRVSAPLALTGITSIDGSAAKWTTGRTISLTGDVTGTSGSFDGSANLSFATTLANSGVSAGTYRSVTVDVKGRVTAGTNPTTLSGYGITDALDTSTTTQSKSGILNLTNSSASTSSTTGALVVSGGLGVGGTIHSAGGLVTATSSGIRMKTDSTANGYGTIFRVDSQGFYVLFTNQNDANGNFNSLRPFYISYTGNVGLETPVFMAGGGSTTTANLTFNDSTLNWLSFNTVGIAPPSFTTRSLGTKICLFPTVTATDTDYAIGMDELTMWFSVPRTSNRFFKWYGGETLGMQLTGAGNLSVYGATASTSKTTGALVVTGGVGIGGDLWATNLASTALAGTGNRAVYSTSTGVLTNSSSDISLKTNINHLSYGLNNVLKLNPVSYQWKDKNKLGSQIEIGLIAQEVQEIIPEVVARNDDGTLSLDYPKLVVVLINAIKELKEELNAIRDQ